MDLVPYSPVIKITLVSYMFCYANANDNTHRLPMPGIHILQVIARPVYVQHTGIVNSFENLMKHY